MFNIEKWPVATSETHLKHECSVGIISKVIGIKGLKTIVYSTHLKDDSGDKFEEII
jgi:hypothetical protein